MKKTWIAAPVLMIALLAASPAAWAGSTAKVEQIGDGNFTLLVQKQKLSPAVARANLAKPVRGRQGIRSCGLAGSPSGSTNYAASNQWGAGNSAYIVQAGSGNQAVAHQSGYNNKSYILQYGKGHSAETMQTGSNNTVVVIQKC